MTVLKSILKNANNQPGYLNDRERDRQEAQYKKSVRFSDQIEFKEEEEEGALDQLEVEQSNRSKNLFSMMSHFEKKHEKIVEEDEFDKEIKQVLKAMEESILNNEKFLDELTDDILGIDRKANIAKREEILNGILEKPKAKKEKNKSQLFPRLSHAKSAVKELFSTNDKTKFKR